jgi:CheY-like chemotaxis protein
MVVAYQDASPSETFACVTESLLRDLVERAPNGATIADWLSGTTQTIARSLNASACTIRLVEDSQLSVGFAWGYQDASSRAHPIRIDRRLERIVRDREPLWISDLESDADLPPERRERMRREGFRAFLGVPMVAADRVEGIPSLYYPHPRDISVGETAPVRVVADCLALSLQSRRWQERAQRAQALESPRSTPTPSTVLVVDDLPYICMLLRDVANREGHNTIAFESGKEAMRYLETGSADLIITDLRMSDVSGLEVARFAKQQNPTTGVLLFTGSLEDVSLQELRESQVDLALPKPFPIAPLITAITTLLSRQGPRQASPGERMQPG